MQSTAGVQEIAHVYAVGVLVFLREVQLATASLRIGPH
jgi:hypothetical protein